MKLVEYVSTILGHDRNHHVSNEQRKQNLDINKGIGKAFFLAWDKEYNLKD